MSKLSISTFSQYDLTQQETLAGSILSGSQKELLQTELAKAAEQKLALDFDPEHPLLFAQHEAFLKGQMSVYRVLLDRSDISEKLLQTLPRNS